jgi:hypothetical protein
MTDKGTMRETVVGRNAEQPQQDASRSPRQSRKKQKVLATLAGEEHHHKLKLELVCSLVTFDLLRL